MSVTQQRIANMAKVSRAIVSKILSNAPNSHISKATQEKVIQIAHRLNYKSKINIQRHHNIVISLYNVEYLSHYFFSTIVSGIASQTGNLDFDVQFLSTNPKILKKQPELYFLNRLKNRNVKGYIIIDQVVPDSEILKLKQNNIPCVLINREITNTDIPCILLNEEKVGYDLTSFLIHKDHQKFAFFIASKKWNQEGRRLKGFKKALEENGLSYSEDMLFELIGATFDETDIETTNLIIELLNRKDRPTAILTSNDVHAARIIQIANSMGMKIPEDFAITGWNDTELASFFTPPLTSVRIPLKEMGEKSIILLEMLIEGKMIERNKILLEQKIIVRDSC